VEWRRASSSLQELELSFVCWVLPFWIEVSDYFFFPPPSWDCGFFLVFSEGLGDGLWLFLPE